MIHRFWVVTLFLFSFQVLAAPAHVILVDKKKNTLELTQYHPNRYETLKKFRTTVGRVQGDKQAEDDLKTPEGVYTFTRRLTLDPKFGDLAFYMNYPNAYDQIAGRTGYDIMLHATDQPGRLNKDFDSKGCIVVKNEEINLIDSYVRVGITPILVFNSLADDYRKPAADSELKKFFSNWIQNWKTKNLEGYLSHYHSEFRSGGLDLKGWKTKKRRLNQVYDRIEIDPKNVHYLRHPKYSVIMFEQNYTSWHPNGKKGHRSQGTKTITVAREDGKYRILSEEFSPKLW